jgi:two-component system sensor histidine kinase TctE
MAVQAPMVEPSVGPPRLESLRTRLQRQVLIPLALTWLLGSSLAAGVAYAFTQQAFDRSLLDDAYALAAQVTESQDGEMALNLSPREVGALLFDQSERVFFNVRRSDGQLVAGHAALAGVPREPGQGFAFGDQHFNGLDLRAVTLARARQHDFVVTVGQTVHSRTLVLKRLLALAVVPQAVLLLLLGLWLRGGIRRALQPLATLQQALQARDADDLSPLTTPAPTRDVAHLRQAASDLMARVAVSVQAQREFSGNVAHELRTPLAGIRALAAYGLAHAEPQVWRQQLQLIQQSEQRATHLVDQLLALAMADESRTGLPLAPVRLDTLVRDTLVQRLPRADADHLDLGAVGLDEPCTVLGHPALLEGVLGNLLDNAWRHGRPTDTGLAHQVTVEVASAEPGVQGPGVLLVVTDNGPGMSAALCERALERWERGRTGVQLRAGAGLGLAIVARYVGLMAGRLELGRPAHGSGLRVSVWLPAAA